jgi:hypothetical protein
MSSRTYMRVVERLGPLPTYKLVPFSGDAQESEARNFFLQISASEANRNYFVNLCFEKDFRFCYEIRTSVPRARRPAGSFPADDISPVPHTSILDADWERPF